MSGPLLRVLAFGAGVQSTALALLSLERDDRLMEAARGPADLVVFADPGSESSATLRVVRHVRQLCRGAGVPFRVARYSGARAARLSDSLAKDLNFSTIPAFVKSPDGSVGRLMRACTRDYKIRPIAAAIREHIGRERITSGSVDVWLGISVDEVARAKEETEITWQRRVFPLLDMRWNRSDCAAYLRGRLSVPVERSACLFCPFHSDLEWKRIWRSDKDGWRQAVHVDRSLRQRLNPGGITGDVYLHRSCQALEDLPFMKNSGQIDMWAEECEGICGL